MSDKRCFIFGHPAHWITDPVNPQRTGWYYDDTGERHISREGIMRGVDVVPRPCPHCGAYQTALGHDPCIANLPGVNYACCGHGVEPGYAAFSNGLVLRGVFDHLRPAAAKAGATACNPKS